MVVVVQWVTGSTAEVRTDIGLRTCDHYGENKRQDKAPQMRVHVSSEKKRT